MGSAPAREKAGGGLLCFVQRRRRRRGKPRQKVEGAGKDGRDRAADKDRCRNCSKIRHWARDCKEPRRQERAHLAQDDEEEPALLMSQVCAINTEAEDRGRRVELDEPRARVNLGRAEEAEEMWYLDTGASNHKTGNHAAFSELDTGVIGT